MERRGKTTVTISSNTDTIEQIDGMAEEQQRSHSSMMQIILDRYLDVDSERAVRRHEQMQEAYASERADEETREIFYKVVREFKDFHKIFDEMRRYEHIQEKELFITLMNKGWVRYLEEFNEVRLMGNWMGVMGNMRFNHIQKRPFDPYRL